MKSCRPFFSKMETTDLQTGLSGWLKNALGTVTDLAKTGTDVYTQIKNVGKKQKQTAAQPLQQQSAVKYWGIGGAAVVLAGLLGVVLFLGRRKKG